MEREDLEFLRSMVDMRKQELGANKNLTLHEKATLRVKYDNITRSLARPKRSQSVENV